MANLSVDQMLRRAAAHARKGEVEEARKCYGEVLKAFPANARARQGLDALGTTRPVQAAGKQPPQAEVDELVARFHRGDLVAVADRGASLVGKFPDSFVLWNLLGATNARLMRSESAVEAFRNAVRINPRYAEAHNNLATLLLQLGRLDEALAAARRALQLRPGYAQAASQMLCLQLLMCDWNDHARLERQVRLLGAQSDVLPPFAVHTMIDDPAVQQQVARAYAARRLLQPESASAPAGARAPGRLRVGYFSSDVHDHATLYLMAGLFREHDRSRFEVFLYSYGHTRSGEWRARVAGDVEHFHDVADFSDEQIAALARSDELDIAIDLKGYTRMTRSEVFRYRLAPLQVNYLGFPGTMGSTCIDYLIGDPVVITDESREFHDEKIITLPHVYLAADNQREIATDSSSRAEHGLPEEAFVFCCFNANHKISPREFSIWMRCLAAKESSVLWLLESNRWSRANLCSEAAARGIDPARLVFAPNVPPAQHLARHRHADLFLDTFNYNAHTTASDALWTGLPLVTRAGRQMSARVSASLLTGLGLAEMITQNDAEYEALILALACDPERLAEAKAKLARNRLTFPTFDTVRYTRNFETGLERAHALHLSGRAPEDIRV